MIVIDNIKAIEVTKTKLRTWRVDEFKKNDLAIQNALVDGTDTVELIARRDYLRDLTATCDSKNLDELQTILSTVVGA